MNSGMRAVMRRDECLRGLFGELGAFLPGLCLRLLLAAGIFGGPVRLAPVHAASTAGAAGAAGSWVVAATTVGALFLLLGLATRYVAALFLLSGLSVVWPLLITGSQALALTGTGAMTGGPAAVAAGLVVGQAALLLVLVGYGPGRLSLDHLVARRHGLA